VRRPGGLALLLVSAVAFAARHDGGAASFELPQGWRAEQSADVSAEHAWRVSPPAREDGKRPPVQGLVVLVGSKKLGDADLEVEAAGWHSAHVRNRAAWGMRGAGGSPRDLFRQGSHRLVRWRDRVDSAIGANEQTITCGVLQSRMVCVIAFATPDARDDADTLSQALLVSLKRR
jgi:hypothetical protein